MRGYPDRTEARKMLDAAYAINPGTWKEHCLNVARMAETIASRCGMDPEKAYVLGLLHDIGRGEYKSWNQMHHVIYGYRQLLDDYPEAAKICLTHSFGTKDIREYGDNVDLKCSDEDIRFINKYLETVEYDDYDLLIQLCDSMCLPEGITLLQVRLLDVASRYGVNEYILRRWKRFFEIKDYFDGLCGCNINSLFREEIERSLFD